MKVSSELFIIHSNELLAPPNNARSIYHLAVLALLHRLLDGTRIHCALYDSQLT